MQTKISSLLHSSYNFILFSIEVSQVDQFAIKYEKIDLIMCFPWPICVCILYLGMNSCEMTQNAFGVGIAFDCG